MDMIERLNSAMARIEETLEESVDWNAAAKTACLDTAGFKRLFCYMTGRKRHRHGHKVRLEQRRRVFPRVQALARPCARSMAQKRRSGDRLPARLVCADRQRRKKHDDDAGKPARNDDLRPVRAV